MADFQVYFSNHIENLFDDLSNRFLNHDYAESFLSPEYVLLDNKTLGGWINLQLAQKQAVAANINYIQPSSLFWLVAKALMADQLPKETPLLKDEMKWKLFALLGDQSMLNIDCMSPVKSYLDGNNNKQLKRYQLAASIADLFDQYLIFRPDWLLSWQKDEVKSFTQDANEAWQKVLWKSLAIDKNKKSLMHRAAIENLLFKKLANLSKEEVFEKLPIKRLFVFGMTTMAPSMLQLLQLLGRHMPVCLYVLNPSQEFWFDCKSSKEWLQGKKRRINRDIPLVVGNPLLLSNGQQVRDFIEQIVADEGFDYQVEESFKAPVEDSLLHCVQQDILTLTHAGDVASLSPGHIKIHDKRIVPLRENDQNIIPSMHIHSCHSAMREVEVLREQLLDMFAKDHTLRPRDVVVMMPQAGKYLPYIEAVFSGSAEYLPYHITDLSMVEESPLLNSIDVLLALPKSRLTLSEVLSIIEVPAVQRQFNLDRKSYEQLKALLVKAGARWGLDAEHRQQQGLPAYSEFSWEFAINRLLSGFSMAEQDENADAFIVEMASDALAISPLDEIEGGSAELLNSFMRFWKTLTHYRGELQYEKTALQWSDCIANLLESFFAVDDDEEELRALREIRKLLQVLRQTGIEEWHIDKIALDVVRDFLKTALKDTSHRSHQWREGVKFCSLMPMRGVPFRVIYIMGMNQGDYPGRVEKKSFDLMRHHHRTGDRSRSVDDRWLFLEALLSARDVFHVSYIGHDQRKNDVRQPSVLVAELIDYLRDGYDAPINQYITEHPLQPFSKQYFLAEKNKPNTRLVSYNQQAFAIASASSNVKNTSEYIWPISETAKQIIEVSIDDFIGFFTDPAKWFLNNKYKTYVSIKDNGISDEELFEMNALNAWQAREAIKKQSINSDASISSLVDKLEVTWQAQARWPLGSAGDSFKNKLKGTIDHAWLDAAKLKIAPRQVFVNELVKSHFGSLHISGNVTVYDDSVIEHSASKRKEKTELQFYLRALFSALTDSSIKQAQAFFYKDKSVAEITLQLEGDFHRALLQQLVEVYLQYRDYGLPFLPELSKKISDAQQGSSAQALIDNAWYGSQYILGVQSDITQRAYYINKERLESPQFTQVSIHVWQAISSWLSHVEVVKEKG